MKNICILLSVAFLMVLFPSTAMGQESGVTTITKHYYVKKYGKDYHLALYAKYIKKHKELNKYAVRFLFENDNSTDILDAFNNYVGNFGGKRLKTIDGPASQIIFSIELCGREKGKYENYFLERRDETPGNNDSSNKIHELIYDVENKRILTVYDVFVPKIAKSIVSNQLTRNPKDSLVGLYIDNNSIVYTLRARGGKQSLRSNYIYYDNNPLVFTTQFLKFMGIEVSSIPGCPVFPGGDVALKKYLEKNLKYPKVAKQEGIQGRVPVSFYVEADGSISDVKVANEVFVHPLFKEEAIRLVENMPKWIPAIDNGKIARLKRTIIIPFTLDDKADNKEKQKEEDEKKLITQRASFPGGYEEMTKYLSNNLRYPVSAKRRGIQGRVVVKFIVEKNGKLSNIKVDNSSHQILEEEALRLVSEMPKWIPAMKDGEAITENKSVSVFFNLDGGKGD